MDFGDSSEEAKFRAHVRQWLSEHAPAYSPEPNATDEWIVEIIRRWLAAKADAGFVGFTAPKEYGGRGTGWMERIIFEQEEGKFPIAQLPVPYGRGNSMSVILAHGTPAQLEKFVRPTLRGEFMWCQMFSEPSAGNDIAALRSRATRDGQGWRISGQKVWVTGAHMADWGMLVVRTDATVPKHKGLTYFLIDMRSSGIDVRPLRQINGRSDFNEVFFSDVYVPDDCRVGGIGEGWNIVLTTLMAERPNAISAGGIAFGGKLLDEVVRIARRVPGQDNKRAMDDPLVQARIAEFYTTLTGVELTIKRMTSALSQGKVPGPEGAVGKFVWTRTLQEMAKFGLELMGPQGMVVDADDPDISRVHDRFLSSVGFRQAGGTDDISRSVIAERVLGLPPDPRGDKDIPFSELPVGR